jgi:AcrR family transcriptional regulator
VVVVVTRVGKRPSARERLLAASGELFYRDGVFSTGIDAVIEKAGVAKGSLYYIFGSKDELVAAYLRGRLATWRNAIEAAQAGAHDADGKILAIFDALADYVSRPDFEALADALIVLYHGALATAGFAEPGPAAALTAKRIARLTLAAAKASSST